MPASLSWPLVIFHATLFHLSFCKRHTRSERERERGGGGTHESSHKPQFMEMVEEDISKGKIATPNARKHVIEYEIQAFDAKRYGKCCVQCIDMIRCTRIFAPSNVRMHWRTLAEVIRFDLTQYSHLPLSQRGKQKQENNKKHLCGMIDDNYCWQSEVKLLTRTRFCTRREMQSIHLLQIEHFPVDSEKESNWIHTTDRYLNFFAILNCAAHELAIYIGSKWILFTICWSLSVMLACVSMCIVYPGGEGRG